MNKNQVIDAAKKITVAIEEEENAKKSIFEEIAKQIETINPSLGGFEELSAILSLPDEQFAFFGPIFLDELQKSFNNISDKMALVQTLNALGVKLEDIQKDYLTLINEIDEQFKNVLTAPKRSFLKELLGITFNAIADTEGVAKKVIQIPIELCHPNAKIPTYANIGDAGLDVYALEDITIKPGETKLVKTGLKVAIPFGYELQVRPKSGRTLKTKFRVGNAPGTIDSGYRDEIGIIIDNIESPIKDITYEFDINGHPMITSIEHGTDFTIGAGEKFAQLVLNEVPKASFYQVDSVANVEGNRGGGFGSTGLV